MKGSQSQHNGPVILINKFSVNPKDLDQFLKAWAAEAGKFKEQPGFISTQLHRGIGGSGTFVNYAEEGDVSSSSPSPQTSFLTDQPLENCNYASTGKNDYFILEPRYQVILEGKEDGKKLQMIMTVLDETKIVDGVETRVVEEKETEFQETTLQCACLQTMLSTLGKTLICTRTVCES
jgi:hypothetical protein